MLWRRERSRSERDTRDYRMNGTPDKWSREEKKRESQAV